VRSASLASGGCSSSSCSFPAIVGPVLLIGAHRHGASFAAQEATGTLLGLAALSGFALAYGRTALRASWPVSVAAGWAVAAATAGLVGAVGGNLLAGVVTAIGSLALAHQGIPRTTLPQSWLEPPRGDLALRMAVTVLMVVSLAAVAGWLGPTTSGVLTALPVLACVLAAFTHARHGGAAATQLLRGMLSGMAGFVVFCLLVAAVVRDAGITVTFMAVTAAALFTQGAVAWASTRSAPAGRRAGFAPLSCRLGGAEQRVR